MKKLLVLSGKGGTGKTTVAGAFIKLADAKGYADCDVDAPNLHLIMEQCSEPIISDYFGLPKGQINPTLCNQCGLCIKYCRFDAIKNNNVYSIDTFACEGCGLCQVICPQKAVDLKPMISGKLKLFENDYLFSTAQLVAGSGNSGMLVTEVKKSLLLSKRDIPLAIIDGSPGIGCPVIASISGVDMILLVTEPSLSGLNDMKRIIKTADSFKVPVSVCINKYDINIANSEIIEDFCRENNLFLSGKIPYDPDAVKATNNGNSIVDEDCKAGEAIRNVFNSCINILLK